MTRLFVRAYLAVEAYQDPDQTLQLIEEELAIVEEPLTKFS